MPSVMIGELVEEVRGWEGVRLRPLFGWRGFMVGRLVFGCCHPREEPLRVWTKLPEPRLFAGLLWNKAGLPAGYWPPDIAVYRYGTERFGRPAGQRTSPE